MRSPTALRSDENYRAVRAFARLKPGVAIERARSALQPLFVEESQHLPKEYLPGLSLALRPLRDRPRLPDGAGGGVSWRYVTPNYFAALGIPFLRGRTFSEQDRAPGASAIVLNDVLARRLFPGEDPVGRHIFPSPKGEWHTVVGVVGDIRGRGLSQPPEPEYYVVRKHTPDEVLGDGSGFLAASALVRTPQDPHGIAPRYARKSRRRIRRCRWRSRRCETGCEA